MARSFAAESSAPEITAPGLSATSCVYIDTNIFIYYVESSPGFVRAVSGLFERIDHAGAMLVTSELTIAECIYLPARERRTRALDAYTRLFDSGEITILPLDGALARRAALNGGKLGLKLNDSIHFTSAIEYGCDCFVTSDARFKSGPLMKVISVRA